MKLALSNWTLAVRASEVDAFPKILLPNGGGAKGGLTSVGLQLASRVSVGHCDIGVIGHAEVTEGLTRACGRHLLLVEVKY